MLFRKKIEKHCSYCVHSGKVDDNTCICAKKGLTQASDHCRKFKYDPLKRVPSRMKPKDFDAYDMIDFSL